MGTQRYVALLRGLNVGGHNRLAMKDLCAVFTAAGALNVSTYIQSGNVLFDASGEVAKAIISVVPVELKRRFKVQTPVVMRSSRELAAVVAGNPHASISDEAFWHVAFLSAKPTAQAIETFDVARFAPDVVTAKGRELYLTLPNGVGQSKLTNAFFDSALKTVSTLRNWRTVLALNDLI